MPTDINSLQRRVGELEQRVSRSGRNGRDGRDGRDGFDGDRGHDADPTFVVTTVQYEVSRVFGALPPLQNGTPGKDADPAMVAALVADAIADMPKPRDGIDADPEFVKAEIARVVGEIHVKDGERGPRGPDGQIGPMPRHEWNGTRLRFEIAAELWGKWVDLRGPPGARGGVTAFGGGGGVGLQGPPGPPGTPGSGGGFSYFPTGW